jgi:hypothetical protein
MVIGAFPHVDLRGLEKKTLEVCSSEPLISLRGAENPLSHFG